MMVKVLSTSPSNDTHLSQLHVEANFGNQPLESRGNIEVYGEMLLRLDQVFDLHKACVFAMQYALIQSSYALGYGYEPKTM